MKNIVILSLFVFSTGCCCTTATTAPVSSTTAATGLEPAREVVVVKGPAETRWEETMHDTIKVPGKIDPTNTYYRAPHQTVVEIRPGRYQGVNFSGDRAGD